MKRRTVLAVMALACTIGTGAQTLPYRNPALSAHERAIDLCSRMTLEEKAIVMMDK